MRRETGGIPTATSWIERIHRGIPCRQQQSGGRVEGAPHGAGDQCLPAHRQGPHPLRHFQGRNHAHSQAARAWPDGVTGTAASPGLLPGWDRLRRRRSCESNCGRCAWHWSDRAPAGGRRTGLLRPLPALPHCLRPEAELGTATGHAQGCHPRRRLRHLVSRHGHPRELVEERLHGPDDGRSRQLVPPLRRIRRRCHTAPRQRSQRPRGFRLRPPQRSPRRRQRQLLETLPATPSVRLGRTVLGGAALGPHDRHSFRPTAPGGQ